MAVTKQASRFGTDLVRDLVRVAEVLASPADGEAKLSHLCSMAVHMIGCDRSSIFLAEGAHFRARFNHGNPPDVAAVFPAHVVKLDDPLIARAIETRTFVVVNEAATDPLMNTRVAERARIQAIVVAPLFAADGSPGGFMTAEYNERPGEFTDLSASLLLGLAKLGETVLRAEHDAAERRELRRQLEIAARLEALSRMSAGLAHDLTNQLAAILGFAGLLRAREPSWEVDVLIEAAEASLQLGNRLMQFARGGTVDRAAPIDVSAATAALMERLQHVVASHRLVVDIEPGLVTFCTETEIEQIVTNFVLNARDASPLGREILVRVASRPGDDGLPAEIALSVVDQGTGIDPDVLISIFDPFFTTKEAGSGTGLGLSSVHGIARSLGGTVEVDSTVGVGSTFTVVLPVAPSPATATSTPPVADEARRSVVVVVDDMAPALEATATVLESAGHEVFAADGATEALEIVSSLEAVDLLVTDVVMPGTSGFQLAERVRTLLPDLPVIFMSGLVADLDDRSLPGGGAVSFIGKPYRPADLVTEAAEMIVG